MEIKNILFSNIRKKVTVNISEKERKIKEILKENKVFCKDNKIKKEAIHQTIKEFNQYG